MVTSKIIDFGDLENALLACRTQEERLKYFNSGEFTTALEKKVSLFDKDVRVVTLDIFDTVLLRDGESEISKFYRIAEEQSILLQDKYGYKTSAEDLFLSRMSSTKTCYHAIPTVDGCREGSINLIYKSVCGSLNISGENLIDELVNVELNVESKSLLLNKGLLTTVKNLWPNATLGLISDMYLHSYQLTDLLTMLDFVSYDFLYSSADTKVSKNSSGLFDIVSSEKQLTGEEWLHLGDALIGDYMSPIKKGIMGVQLPIPEEMERERTLDKKNFLTRKPLLGNVLKII